MTEEEIQLIDSRRITGGHLVLRGAGALIDLAGPDGDRLESLIVAWQEAARAILDALEWPESQLAVRRVPGGASLGFTAPIDALYAATEVNEWSFAVARAAEAGARSGEPNEVESLELATHRLREVIEEEQNPGLIELIRAADQLEIPWVSDDDHVSIGLGRRSRTWPVGELPSSTDFADPRFWSGLGEIPVFAVTGTNGKTTTIRLLAAIAAAEGVVPGFTSTDGVFVGEGEVASGDYSGPGGARMIVRDPRVDVALLETARGGLLRRGLPLARATAVAITNVAADHLGEFGVHDVDAIAETKWVVSRLVTGVPGCLVLNADDPRLLSLGKPRGNDVTWVSLRGDHPTVLEHRAAGGHAATLEGTEGTHVLTLWSEGRALPLGEEAGFPVTAGGAARHNTANALTAAALAYQGGMGLESIIAGLRAFEPTPENSPGRGNWFDVAGVRHYVDFAHNPHGFEAMVSMLDRIPAERIGIVLGQAGDRDDASICEMIRIAGRLNLARIVIKEMPEYLRGRAPGEVPALIERELVSLGLPADRISHAPTEGEAVRDLRAWARAGDLLVLPLHAEREAVIASLRA